MIPTLDTLDYADGWLAETPQFVPGDSQPVVAEIASLAGGAFSLPPSVSSWLPSQGAAMAYQSFASADGISRALTPLRPRQLMLQMGYLSAGAEAVTIAFRPSWTLAATGMIVAGLVGVLAGLAPGLHAARSDIVAALRT